MHDNTDKNPDVYHDQNGALWAPVGDLLWGLRLVKPGQVNKLNVFPEKLFVTARFKVAWGSVIAFVGYFINDEAEPRLVLQTTATDSFVNLNGTLDISDIFPMTDEVQVADLHVMYRAEGLFPSMALACHQVYYCVRR